uniref:J domain-containing protein n=1 Tax=Eutreptiella gymnastica TaxID=73025 RepID=A0A7S1IL73_9EUGL
MSDIHSDDYYKVLGVSRDATEQEVARAYKKLALKYHPDKNPDNRDQAEEHFKKVSEAYDCLSDSSKRKTYDQFGKQGLQGGMGPEDEGGMHGGGPGMRFSGGTGMSKEQAEQIFTQFFGGGGMFSMGDDDGTSSFSFMRVPSMGGKKRARRQPGSVDDLFGNMGGSMPFGGMMGADMLFGGMDADSMFGEMPRMGFGGPMRRDRGHTQPNLIPLGTQVVIIGLKSTLEHNGKEATIVQYDAAAERYTVETVTGHVLALKPTNLTQVVGVKLWGLSGKPELNGATGKIAQWNPHKARYEVQVPKLDKILSLKPGNVQLPVSTVVRIEGLSNAARYNGKWGKILDVDMVERRYQVQLDNATQLKVKWENVRV